MAEYYLVIGGGSSGKSLYAEQLAVDLSLKRGWPVYYAATALITDPEMKERVEKHRSRRPDEWVTWEEPYDLAALFTRFQPVPAVILVEGMGTWLTNLILFKQEEEFIWDKDKEKWCWQQVEAFLETSRAYPGDIILVADEVGMDLVPATKLGRVFRDLNGKVNQKLAFLATEAVLIIAGLPMRLKAAKNMNAGALSGDS